MLGEDIDMQEAEDMIQIGDIDQDGYISFEDFLVILRGEFNLAESI